MKFNIKKHIPKIIFLVILTVSIVLFYALKLNRFFNYENAANVKNFILKFSVFGPLIIYILYIVFNLLCMPTLFFNFISGYLYGPYYGFALAWSGMMLGLMSSFINVRYLFKNDFQNKFANNMIVREIENYTKKYHGWTVLFFRIFFVFPYNFQNVAYGLSTIKPMSYFIGSLIGILPTTIMHVVIGHLIDRNMMGMDNLKTIFMYIGLFLFIFGAIFFTSLIIKRKLKAQEKTV